MHVRTSPFLDVALLMSGLLVGCGADKSRPAPPLRLSPLDVPRITFVPAGQHTGSSPSSTERAQLNHSARAAIPMAC